MRIWGFEIKLNFSISLSLLVSESGRSQFVRQVYLKELYSEIYVLD